MNISKVGYVDHIEKDTLDNDNYRKVLYTGKFSQLVLMTLQPGQSIGEEVHDGHDQFFRFEQGNGVVMIDGEEYEVSDGDAVIIPSGANHNVTNSSDTEVLKLYTIYSPPQHADGLVQAVKAD